jgi:hypothetical protein
VVVVASVPSGKACVVESAVVSESMVTGWPVEEACASAVYRGSALVVVLVDAPFVLACAGSADIAVVPRAKASIPANALAWLRIVVLGLRRSPEAIRPTSPRCEPAESGLLSG